VVARRNRDEAARFSDSDSDRTLFGALRGLKDPVF
jgi:hypothetical protein